MITSSAPAYAELHGHSNFSLLDGTSDPEELVESAASLGLRALALTDHDSLAGIVRFAAAAKRKDVHAIVGVELTVADPLPTSRTHLILLAENLAGHRNLCALLTQAYMRGGKDDPHVWFDTLVAHAGG